MKKAFEALLPAYNKALDDGLGRSGVCTHAGKDFVVDYAYYLLCHRQSMLQPDGPSIRRAPSETAKELAHVPQT